tara:strand:- start:9101 stop:9517 length:417 start_codon:yes stop_codon:yes gene_type:complete
MSSKERIKGNRIENEIVKLHQGLGFTAERVPLSGQVGGSYSGDVVIEGLRAEVKARKSGSGFVTLEKWMGDNDLLFLRKDRQPPMVCMPWTTYEVIACNGIPTEGSNEPSKPQREGGVDGAGDEPEPVGQHLGDKDNS